MASKTYSMLYQLSAQLANSFGTTFSKAQQSVARMQQEINALNRAQGDISAYQRQQAAVEATRNKLQMLQQQYDNIQREIQETGTFNSDLENKLLSKQAQIDKTNEKLQQQTDKLHTMGDALREAGVDTADLTRSSAELEKELGDLKAAQEEAAEGADGFGKAGTDAFVTVGNALVAAGIAAGLKEISEAYMDCINLAGDFEATMSAVEAIAGADAQGMAALNAEAKELGATTKFTAQQSGEAMTYMAMAGWDVNDMLSGMAGVMDLAAASGEDLSTVSDIVTDSLTAFGLTAEDSAHFSDVLAAAAANANTNVSIMGETFKASASIAGALGYSIEDVAVAVGLMANAGVKGSVAGTALKNTFNGLLQGVTLTGAAFGEYEYNAVQANGTMKSFGDTINELRGYFQQMTEAERVNNAMALAGQRGYNGLLAILNSTDDEFSSLTETINDCSGAAQQMAQIRMDNMVGDLTLMQSAWEAVRVSIGENFTEAMGGVYSAGTEVLNVVNDFIKANPELVRAVTAFVGVLGTATVGLTGYVAAASAAQAVSKVFTTVLGGAMGPIGWITLGLAGTAAAVAAVSTAINQSNAEYRELTEYARSAGAAIDEASDAFENSTNEAMASAMAAESYIDRLEAIEQATHHHVEGNEEYSLVLEALSRQVPELAGMIDAETGSIEGGTAALREHIAAMKQDAQAAAGQEYINTLTDDYNQIATETFENKIKLTQAETKLQAAQKASAAAAERMAELGKNGRWLTKAEREEYLQLQGAMEGYSAEIQQAQSDVALYQKAVDAGNASMAEMKETMQNARDAVEELMSVTGEYTNLTDEEKAGIEGLNDLLGDSMTVIGDLALAYDEAYKAALESFQGQFGLFDQAQADADATVAAAQTALDSQLSYWESYAGNIDVLRGQSYESLGVTEENFNALMAYVQTGSEEAAGLAASMVEAIQSGDTEAVANLATTLGEINALQESTSDDIGQWISGLDEETAKFVQDMQGYIEDLELSGEAQSAAQATIQAYIDQASGMTGAVSAAFASIASAAAAALNSGLSSVPGLTKGGGSSGGGAIKGFFASGTQHAPEGYAVVGEEGPELLYMHGGETVLPARDTAELLTPSSLYSSTESSNFSPTVNVAFNIDGSTPPAGALATLEAYGDEFAERVIGIMKDFQAEMTRRMY